MNIVETNKSNTNIDEDEETLSNKIAAQPLPEELFFAQNRPEHHEETEEPPSPTSSEDSAKRAK